MHRLAMRIMCQRFCLSEPKRRTVRNSVGQQSASLGHTQLAVRKLQPTVQLFSPIVGRFTATQRPQQCRVHVPSDSFGGLSPEKTAANALRNLFTFIAVKIILAQLSGSGRGELGAYNQDDYNDLSKFLEMNPLKDGDMWLTELMQKNPHLGLRVMEVRDAYCLEDFEWDILEKITKKDMKEANTKLMRKFATASFNIQSDSNPGVS